MFGFFAGVAQVDLDRRAGVVIDGLLMRATLRPISPVLLGVLFLIAGYGIQVTLIPLRAAAESWSSFAIGAIGSAYFVGFVFGCLTAPYAILRVGHIRSYAALTSLASATTLAQALCVEVLPWIVFRIIIGVCLAGLYMVIESWLNDQATNANRGTVMSVYVVINYVALTVGQFMVTLASPASFTLFAATAVMISLAAIPVALTKAAQPSPITLVRFRLKKLYHTSPVGMVGVTLVGVVHGAFWSLGAVYAIKTGLSPKSAAAFVGLATLGGALMQWPVGRLSDRLDRRIVLIGLLVAATAISVSLAFLPLAQAHWGWLALLFGATTFPTYSIAAAHAYDHAEPGAYVETAAGVLLANGVGAIIGPLIASAWMEGTRPGSLFLFTAVTQIVLVLFVLSRLWARPAMKTAEKTEFDYAATAHLGAVVSPEALDAEDDNVGVPSEN